LWWLEADDGMDSAPLSVGTVFEGEQLGRWIAAQRAVWASLKAAAGSPGSNRHRAGSKEQRGRLRALGVAW